MAPYQNYEATTIHLLTLILLITIAVFLFFDSRRRRREIIEFITPLFGTPSSSVTNGPTTVNVGLTGPIGITGPVEVTGNVGLTGPIGITGPVEVTIGNTGSILVSSTGTTQIAFESTSTDAFSRLRTSYPYTLFDSAFRYGDSFYYWNTLLVPSSVGGASLNYLQNESAFGLNVTNSGDHVIRETKHVYAYQPGKSLLILCTFVMEQDNSGNLTQKVGYYGNEDGVYFKRQNGVNSFCIKSSTSGSPLETEVTQSAWLINNFTDLDITRTQIVWFDLEWLGVGTVRCGFVQDGKIIHCHSFHHANVSGNTQVYMKSASLPLRYEITSGGSVGTLKQICSTIISEGGYTKISVTRSVSTYNDAPTTLIPLVKDHFVPILSIRLKPGFMDAIIVPSSFDFYLTDNTKAAYWRFSINRKLTPSTGGTSSVVWSSVTNSAVEYGIVSPRTLTASAEFQLDPNSPDNGYVLKEGFVIGGPKGGSILLKEGVNDFFGQLGRTIANGATVAISDTLTLSICATDTSNTSHAVLTYQEDTFTG